MEKYGYLGVLLFEAIEINFSGIKVSSPRFPFFGEERGCQVIRRRTWLQTENGLRVGRDEDWV